MRRDYPGCRTRWKHNGGFAFASQNLWRSVLPGIVALAVIMSGYVVPAQKESIASHWSQPHALVAKAM